MKDNFYISYISGIVIWVIISFLCCYIFNVLIETQNEINIAQIQKDIEKITQNKRNIAKIQKDIEKITEILELDLSE